VGSRYGTSDCYINMERKQIGFDDVCSGCSRLLRPCVHDNKTSALMKCREMLVNVSDSQQLLISMKLVSCFYVTDGKLSRLGNVVVSMLATGLVAGSNPAKAMDF
jgi:hypothetical protein